MRYIPLVLIVLFLGGCATKIPSYPNIRVDKSYLQGSEKEKKLAVAFMNYWKARIDGDYKTSYLYELPYQRYIKGLDKYKELIGEIYKGTTVKLANITYLAPNVAIVRREVKIKNHIFPRKDKWIYVDGKWYHKFYQTVLPPKNPQLAEFQ